MIQILTETNSYELTNLIVIKRQLSCYYIRTSSANTVIKRERLKKFIKIEDCYTENVTVQ